MRSPLYVSTRKPSTGCLTTWATSGAKVSCYGFLLRGSRAPGHAGYVWKDKGPKAKKPVDPDKAIEFNVTVDTLLNRPNMQITEEGDSVVITLPAITIMIKQNK